MRTMHRIRMINYSVNLLNVIRICKANYRACIMDVRVEDIRTFIHDYYEYIGRLVHSVLLILIALHKGREFGMRVTTTYLSFVFDV